VFGTASGAGMIIRYTHINPRMCATCLTRGSPKWATVLTRNVRKLKGTPLGAICPRDARAAASWLPQAYDGTHLPRVRTALSGLPAGWNRACASRPARTPSPPCLLMPRCICLTVRRLHRARLVGGADDGAGAQSQRPLMSL